MEMLLVGWALDKRPMFELSQSGKNHGNMIDDGGVKKDKGPPGLISVHMIGKDFHHSQGKHGERQSTQGGTHFCCCCRVCRQCLKPHKQKC